MKRYIAWLLTFLLICMTGVAMATEKDNGVWRYAINGGKATIISYNGSERKIMFPSELDGCPVTQIGKGGSGSVVWINDFYTCELVFPESVEIIAGGFFTLGEFKKIVIPASVKAIMNGAFSIVACTAIEFAGAPETIGDYAFSETYGGFKSIKINEGTRTLGKCCFSASDRLATVSLPASLESFGDEAFSNCPKLSKITFAEGSQLTTIPEGSFISCTALKSIELPESIESIGVNAFYGCKKLVKITIPQSVVSIDSTAFDGCPKKLTFTVIEGSYAEKWATENGFKVKVAKAK